MTLCFAYIRVSTARQGERGVSLQEQRSSISAFAAKHGLSILTWFEERETAAKRGRPQFAKMLELLRKNKADGVIIHKIDRSARNLRDWSELGELIDTGVAVYFTNESLDLHTRGGRLSADIQAVVAADYIRNLREETKKGIYGRLKQGLLPMAAPLGYLDNGPGAVKTIDPERGPLIKSAFELYASEPYSLRTLADTLYRLGLRNRTGRKVCINSLSLILNNPFYMGLIRLKVTGETFSGIHEPLVSARIFTQVQRRLHSKTQPRTRKHTFLFKGLVSCSSCGNKLVGECQKGHVYYRCRTPSCPSLCLREERIDELVRQELALIQLSNSERDELQALLARHAKEINLERVAAQQGCQLQLAQVKERITRLMDAFLDGSVEQPLFERKKRQLLVEEKELEEKLRHLSDSEHDPARTLRELLELAATAPLSYSTGKQDEKRTVLKMVTANLSFSPNNGSVELLSPFSLIANRQSVLGGCRERGTTRTERNMSRNSSPTSQLLNQLLKWVRESNTTPPNLV